MKDQGAVQRAHDMLVGIITDKVVSINFTEEELRDFMVEASVLCWILDHDHNDGFEVQMKKLEEFLKSRGFRFSNYGN
jgi:hypothetical protein